MMNLKQWKDWRAGLRAELKGLVGRPLPRGHRVEAWTARQVLHHLFLSDRGTAALLERLLAKAGPGAARGPGDWPVRPELLDFPLDTAFSVPAFRGTEPRARVSDRELTALEDDVVPRLLALAEAADGRDLEPTKFPHPLAGPLNFYEWLVFGGVHDGLHLRQLKDDLGLR